MPLESLSKHLQTYVVVQMVAWHPSSKFGCARVMQLDASGKELSKMMHDDDDE